jgi:hypothetical protein
MGPPLFLPAAVGAVNPGIQKGRKKGRPSEKRNLEFIFLNCNFGSIHYSRFHKRIVLSKR